MRGPDAPLAHLSIELGHFGAADLAAGPDHLRRQFRAITPWARAARESLAAQSGTASPAAVSTCVLVDDYLASPGPPAEVVPVLVSAAADSGLALDYLARESACVESDGVPVARLVEDLLRRPDRRRAGWLGTGDPPARPHGRRPGDERRHAIPVDVELWDEDGDGRTWSCAFLSAVWQLLRLGIELDAGEPVTQPRAWAGPLPDKWAGIHPVLRLNPAAAPFPAHRTLSILPPRYLPVEHAVREILARLPRPLPVPGTAGPADRVEYVFTRPVRRTTPTGR
jgi:hypothetical protein